MILVLLVQPGDLALQVMRRAQSNSPRIPPKKYHSFRETRTVNLDSLLQLPGYRPRCRPPSYPAHVSPSRAALHAPRIRVTCVPDSGPTQGWDSPGQGRSPNRSPDRRGRSPDMRGRSPGRRVSRGRDGVCGVSTNLELLPLASAATRTVTLKKTKS